MAMPQTSVGSLPSIYAGTSQADGDEVLNYFAEDTIPFGRCVEAGTASGGAVLYNTGTPIGIAMRTMARASAQRLSMSTADSYVSTDGMNIQTKGSLWVSVDGTGADRAGLTVIENTGQLSTAGADGTHNAVNAWLEEACATTGNVCKIGFDFTLVGPVTVTAHASTHNVGGSDAVTFPEE